MKRLQIPQKLVYEKFYVQEIAIVDLSKMYFLKNAKKTYRPKNRDLNPDWKSSICKHTKEFEHCKKRKCSSPNRINDLNENLIHKSVPLKSIPTFKLAIIASLDLRSLLLLKKNFKFFSLINLVVILCFKISWKI